MKFRLLMVILFFLVSQSRAQNWDTRLLAKINPNSGVNKGWEFVSNKAIPLSVATPFAMLAVGIIDNNAQLKQNAIHTGVALLANGLFTSAIKNSIQRQRPFLARADMITLQGHTTGYSFPSGHTSTTFSVATSLSLSYPKWYVIAPAYTFAAATAYSRMYRGAHYPSDVLGGVIVGTGTSYLTWKLQKLFYKKNKSSKVYPDN